MSVKGFYTKGGKVRPISRKSARTGSFQTKTVHLPSPYQNLNANIYYPPKPILSQMSDYERYGIIKAFENGENLTEFLGKPVEMRQGQYVRGYNNSSYKEADYIVKYENGIEVHFTHNYYTTGKKSSNGRYFVSTPKHFVEVTQQIIIPKLDQSGFDKKMFGSFRRTMRDSGTESGIKAIERHAKKTLNLDVKYSQVLKEPETVKYLGD